MKKVLISGLICLLLLCGCGRRGKPLFDPVYLYYPRVEFGYGSADSAITWEAMDGTGHTEDYSYLLAEYFAGPIDEGLYNPFPEGTTLVHAELEPEAFFIQLSPEALELPEHRFALGCSCLSMTCFELTDVPAVTIACGDRSLTIRREGMLLLDDYKPDTQKNGGTT